jgi:hypothetical protein
MSKTDNAAAQGATPKFQGILASSGQDVLDTRAGLIFKRAKSAMEDKLRTLRRKRDTINEAILNLTDLSVETKDSLRPGDKNFNPSQWVESMCSLTMDLELLEDEINVAEGVALEYFSIAPEATTEGA